MLVVHKVYIFKFRNCNPYHAKGSCQANSRKMTFRSENIIGS